MGRSNMTALAGLALMVVGLVAGVTWGVQALVDDVATDPLPWMRDAASVSACLAAITFGLVPARFRIPVLFAWQGPLVWALMLPILMGPQCSAIVTEALHATAPFIALVPAPLTPVLHMDWAGLHAALAALSHLPSVLNPEDATRAINSLFYAAAVGAASGGMVRGAVLGGASCGGLCRAVSQNGR